jgi:riboflavin kinase/FMN adenylyltransferase
MQWLLSEGARAVVVGPDFRFGQGRAGDVDTLRSFGERHGMALFIAQEVLVDGERVSSSAIRRAVAAGEVERACTLLGRVHDVSGEVVEGDKRGRQLGFPTANLHPDPVLLPADGVYAVVARPLDHEREPILGVANLGTRPTFGAGRSVEVHLFDWATDIYGERLRVGFVARLRGEQKFESVDALTARIRVDCEEARATLAGASREAWAWI